MNERQERGLCPIQTRDWGEKLKRDRWESNPQSSSLSLVLGHTQYKESAQPVRSGHLVQEELLREERGLRALQSWRHILCRELQFVLGIQSPEVCERTGQGDTPQVLCTHSSPYAVSTHRRYFTVLSAPGLGLPSLRSLLYTTAQVDS